MLPLMMKLRMILIVTEAPTDDAHASPATAATSPAASSIWFGTSTLISYSSTIRLPSKSLKSRSLITNVSLDTELETSVGVSKLKLTSILVLLNPSILYENLTLDSVDMSPGLIYAMIPLTSKEPSAIVP